MTMQKEIALLEEINLFAFFINPVPYSDRTKVTFRKRDFIRVNVQTRIHIARFAFCISAMSLFKLFRCSIENRSLRFS